MQDAIFIPIQNDRSSAYYKDNYGGGAQIKGNISWNLGSFRFFSKFIKHKCIIIAD